MSMIKRFAVTIAVAILYHNANGQVKTDLNEMSTLYVPGEIQYIDIAGLETQTITEEVFNNYVSQQVDGIKENPQVKPDENGVFGVQTNYVTFELQQTNEYSSSYHYIGFLPAVNSHLIGHCGEGTCNEFLLDNDTSMKLSLPSYDAGVMGLLFSPAIDRMLIYSSYDGPDYDNFYMYRAEITFYTVEKNKGLNGLVPQMVLFTKEWSIDDLVWIDNTTIGLKIYEGNRAGDGPEGGYRYVKIRLNN